MPVDLLPGESKQLDAQLVPITGPGQAALDRFYVANLGRIYDTSEFEVGCWVKNIGTAPATYHLNMKGEIYINKGQLTRTVDEHRDITIAAGAVYKYWWIWHSFTLDKAWLRVYIDDQPVMPRFDWTIGYYLASGDVEVRAAYVGPDWVNLRYAQRSICDRWDVMAWTPPTGTAIHTKSYPRLIVKGGWTSLYHLVTPLLSGRLYRAYVFGFSPGGAQRGGYVDFTTQ